ncbi:GD17380 [Drosophila simulans]|uniref:GD17380 n=1 Tax=Drosophila simulans TaxID=7240 RepID=B4R6R3_DROSI|nr:GD17380 [Drosophila simulans]
MEQQGCEMRDGRRNTDEGEVGRDEARAPVNFQAGNQLPIGPSGAVCKDNALLSNCQEWRLQDTPHRILLGGWDMDADADSDANANTSVDKDENENEDEHEDEKGLWNSCWTLSAFQLPQSLLFRRNPLESVDKQFSCLNAAPTTSLPLSPVEPHPFTPPLSL